MSCIRIFLQHLQKCWDRSDSYVVTRQVRLHRDAHQCRIQVDKRETDQKQGRKTQWKFTYACEEPSSKTPPNVHTKVISDSYTK
jgi:hypothetical protein